MDLTKSNVPIKLESLAPTSKLDEENGNRGEPMAPSRKKQRFSGEMKRVAEIVLVLSALGRMRGGKSPTEVELELMVEARSKLADLCQEFIPNDIVNKDDIGAVIEDLGLNSKVKDQRFGLRAPKLTISEKLSLGKRKMEEAKLYSTAKVSIGYASHLSQPNSSVASPAKNVSMAHQWPSNEVTTVNTPGSHFRLERPQTMLNNASQGTPNSSANYYGGSWSTQPQSTISFSTAPERKMPFQSTSPSFGQFISQTSRGTFPGKNQPLHHGQTSSFGNNHREIAKIIHKVLQPHAKQHPFWNPPSRDYMNRAMTCQICGITINDVDTLLVCDACEKPYHLNCLQANNMKGVPKSEWHCSRCVKASNGKLFPPKYGPVVTATTAKIASSTNGVPSSTANKVGSMDTKVNQRSPGVQNFPGFVSGAATTSNFDTAGVNANATASAVKTTNIGSQGFRASVICNSGSTAPVSLTETPNSTKIASTSAVMNNGLLPKPITSVGSMSRTFPSPAIPSTLITASNVAQAQTVTENGDSSSTSSGTVDNSVLNTDCSTQVHALTVTSSSNSQQAVSHSETAKATEDATKGQALYTDDGPQAPTENVARYENPSESTSHSDSVNDKTPSKNATEKLASETCLNHTTESPAAVILDQDTKIIAESLMPQENLAYHSLNSVSASFSDI